MTNLPLYLQDMSVKLRYLTTREKILKEQMLLDLSEFVENEMTLVKHLLYSRDAVNQYVEKIPAKNHGKK